MTVNSEVKSAIWNLLFEAREKYIKNVQELEAAKYRYEYLEDQNKSLLQDIRCIEMTFGIHSGINSDGSVVYEPKRD